LGCDSGAFQWRRLPFASQDNEFRVVVDEERIEAAALNHRPARMPSQRPEKTLIHRCLAIAATEQDRYNARVFDRSSDHTQFIIAGKIFQSL